MATGIKDDVMGQAQHFWSMLDELAESDGDAYKKFMAKNLQSGLQDLAVAKPWMCIKTHILKPHKKTLYINICSWSRIAKPKTNTEAIKVTAGPVEDGNDETGAYKIVRVAFNPEVLQECAKNSQEQDMLIENAINYLKDEKNFHISRNFQICQDVKFKGDSENLRDFFKPQSESKQKTEQDKTMENLSKLTPDSLLSQLRVSGDQSEAASDGPDAALRLNGNSKAGLIEEISSVDVKLTCPECDVSLKEADTKRSRRIVARIALPGVQSVADCELNIDEEELSLLVPEKYELHLPLPEKILEDDSTAKFNNKTSSLTVTMPTRSSISWCSRMFEKK